MNQPYSPYSEHIPSFNSTKQRSSSLINQLSHTSRQNLQQFTSDTPINTYKYESSMQVSPQLSAQK